MRVALAVLAFSLGSAAPAVGQDAAPTAAEQTPALQTPANPYRELFTRWDGVNRDSLAAETDTAQPAPAPEGGTSIPAFSPLTPPTARSEEEAVALGRRVGEVVRSGDCARGEDMARDAGDFALLRAVRDHCRQPR